MNNFSAELVFPDFDSVLRLTGGWGRYQVRLLLLLLPFTFFLSYVAYSPVLFLYVPDDHGCRPHPHLAKLLLPTANLSSSGAHLLLELTSPPDPESPTGRSRCTQYDVDFTQVMLLLYR